MPTLDGAPLADLAVACAVLAADGTLPVDALEDYLFLGQLGLDGRIRPVRGVLPALLACGRGVRRAIVPNSNLAEAALQPTITVLGAETLDDVVATFRGAEHRPDTSLAEHGGSYQFQMADRRQRTSTPPPSEQRRRRQEEPECQGPAVFWRSLLRADTTCCS